MGMTPLEPTPTGMWSNSAWASCSLTGWTSPSSRLVLRRRTPQLMSKPTPPAQSRTRGLSWHVGHVRVNSWDILESTRDSRTWRHYSIGVAHVKGRHVSNSKSIPGVDIWETDWSLGIKWKCTADLSFWGSLKVKIFNLMVLTCTIPGSAATFPICFMAGRNPPKPAWK